MFLKNKIIFCSWSQFYSDILESTLKYDSFYPNTSWKIVPLWYIWYNITLVPTGLQDNVGIPCPQSTHDIGLFHQLCQDNAKHHSICMVCMFLELLVLHSTEQGRRKWCKHVVYREQVRFLNCNPSMTLALKLRGFLDAVNLVFVVLDMDIRVVRFLSLKKKFRCKKYKGPSCK